MNRSYYTRIRANKGKWEERLRAYLWENPKASYDECVANTGVSWNPRYVEEARPLGSRRQEGAR